MREHRPKYSELSYVERIKTRCRSHTRVLIARGELARQPCQQCGATKAQAHHRDYTKPREIDWLCRDCHKKLHQQYPGVRIPDVFDRWYAETQQAANSKFDQWYFKRFPERKR